jgi:hypothetical protein
MSGGITFGSSRQILATVVENGIDADDPRVKARVDEAQAYIYSVMIPVNGMLTADVVASGTAGTTLLLPKELQNAIYVEVQNNATVNGQTDVTFGRYDIVNQFTYVDPSTAHDNPLVDQFLQPDPVDPTILRRQYDYPGLQSGATVRVTGAKKWLPIQSNEDYLLVQNIVALKKMIQAIEAEENNDHQGAEAFEKKCFEILTAEVKRHQLDPMNWLKLKSQYDIDKATFNRETFGYFRARLAHELPGGLTMGKSELTRVLEQAEMRLMDRGQWIGSLQEYEVFLDPTITDPILCPKEVEAIVACTWRGQPLDIKNHYFKFVQHGHRWWMSDSFWLPELQDEGETRDANGDMRRQYRLIAWPSIDQLFMGQSGVSGTSGNPTFSFKFIGALRWVKKIPTDFMCVRNFEAVRLMCRAILYEKDEKTVQLAGNEEQKAIKEVDDELSKYLAGQMVIAPVDFGLWTHRRRHSLL